MTGNISAGAIRTPLHSTLLFVILMVLGIVSFRQLPVTRFPNIDIPIVQVRVYQAGTAPVELEAQVTKKIEDAVASVNGLKHITSTVTEGASLTVIEFRLETNSDRAINDVKDAAIQSHAGGIEDPFGAETKRVFHEPVSLESKI